MKKYYPEKMELGPRDIVARAAYNEILEGRGTVHGGVWLDVTHLSKEKIMDRLPTMYKQFKEINGIDISTDKMEVGPTAHYSMGGVVVDIKCRTKIKGLLAVGEVISQIHGANRLGGNSLLDTQVFGKIAGGEAAKLAKEATEEGAGMQNINNQKELLEYHDGGIFVVKEPLSFLKEIQEVMKDNAGIIRDGTKLQKGLQRILEIKEKFYSKDTILKEFKIDNENIVLTFEVKSSLVVCEAIIKCAIMRQESRGAHYRSDYPKLDNKKWKVNIYCTKKDRQVEGNGDMVLFTESVKDIKGSLLDLIKINVKAEHHREFE